ncbi:hypothetical protein H6G89_23840 [Oscillatoria sp. FACHB-1407]|uniref:GspE/PulE/PilB domain-containing protein n=1 Tax=Oscillatoria sp. FACHB-1407 TaxID=2692847 RepID=UPI001686043E|nr:hypothetical protein [Oscillatoria sp. FACHB-1407]MBD2464039.1 hypothetical protein [Oscillatoria sp. FACHB-1407]
MLSPLGDRAQPKPNDPVYELVLSQFQGDLADRLSVEQMFILIDGVLPFEACLYYQVLPLFIEGSRLNLGMVFPNDTSAADYVRRIVSYHNYSLVPRPISSEALQGALTAYLNYSGKKQAANQRQAASNNRPNRYSARSRSGQNTNPDIQKTLVVDSPENLGDALLNDIPSQEPPTPPPHIPFTPSSAQPSTTLQVGEDDAPSFESPLQREDLLTADPQNWQQQKNESQELPPEPPQLLSPLPEIEIQTNYLADPVEVLTTLPPKELLQELLGRVLYAGIGRLYFERQPQYGRVLWSQNGVLQSVLDRLDPATFQGVLDELKQLTHLPLATVQTTKQVEVERLYQQTRLLLRFKLMPTEYGEEATLQVLRGAALKFHQQQQLANLERDALTIAKQLQTKVSEIRDRARLESGLGGAKLDALPALNQLLKHIEEQLGSLADEEVTEE